MDLFLTANDNDNDDDNYWLVERLKKHTLSQKKTILMVSNDNSSWIFMVN